MICLDKIVWVLHRRVKCKSCKKTIAEIDPRFLSKLPTRVAERFEFVTTVTGPGLHQSLVYSLLFLLGKAVMFGTFVKMVNELHAMFYTMDHVSHMDSLAEYSRRKGGLSEINEFGLFSPNTNGYCRVRLTKALVKAAFHSYMASNEEYMQASFQTECDSGLSKDNTFKFAKTIRLQGRSGKVFESSSTGVSLQGTSYQLQSVALYKVTRRDSSCD